MQLLELDGSQLAGVEKHALSFLQLSLVTLSFVVPLLAVDTPDAVDAVVFNATVTLDAVVFSGAVELDAVVFGAVVVASILGVITETSVLLGLLKSTDPFVASLLTGDSREPFDTLPVKRKTKVSVVAARVVLLRPAALKMH